MNTTTEALPEVRRPKRADALSNYEKLIAAAREAFTSGGSETSLEEIARRAQVGIGTLYRHFPTRQELLEAVYVQEIEALGRSADEVAALEPWDALAAFLHRCVGYWVTKRALAEGLLAYLDRDAPFFKGCRTALFESGEPLFARAQEAGVVRPDATFADALHIVGGIAKIPGVEPGEVDRLLDLAIDGLRYRAAG